MSEKTILCGLAAAIALPYLAVGTVTSTSTGWNSAHDLSSWDDSTAWHIDQEYVIPKGKTLVSGKNGVNTKAATPFALNGPDGKLHVSFDMSGVTDGKSHEVAICTLPTATAEALRANIVLERPMANYSAQLLPASSSGGATQTIFAKVCPRGFMMNIK